MDNLGLRSHICQPSCISFHMTSHLSPICSCKLLYLCRDFYLKHMLLSLKPLLINLSYFCPNDEERTPLKAHIVSPLQAYSRWLLCFFFIYLICMLKSKLPVIIRYETILYYGYSIYLNHIPALIGPVLSETLTAFCGRPSS